MTIGAMWIRTRGPKSNKELITAADSRLRSPGKWDGCPKILPLSRGDCVIGFTGNTRYAYPLMLQISNSVSQYWESGHLKTSLSSLKGHIVRTIDDHLKQIGNLGPLDQEKPDATLLFGGYCWKTHTHAIWSLSYSDRLERFSFRRARPYKIGHRRRTIAWFGSKKYVSKASELLSRRMSDDNHPTCKKPGFDMEPFEIIRDMIRNGSEEDGIGGPIQLTKTYENCTTSVVPIFWPNSADGRPTVHGRYCLEYETVVSGIMDPDTLEFTSQLKWRQATSRLPTAE